ncbi:hypothetical protein K8I61_08470 [bacterium]|nr:hypothetical protein [bacterium]
MRFVFAAFFPLWILGSAFAAFAAGLPPTSSWHFPPQSDDVIVWNSSFELSVVLTGFDANQDGFDDVVLGFPQIDYANNTFDENSGTIFQFLGTKYFSDNDFSYITRSDSLSFASRLIHGGDINGDKYEDIIVHDPAWNITADGAKGRMFIYFGSEFGLSETSATIVENKSAERFEYCLVGDGNGDMNNDGYDDYFCSRRISNETSGIEDDVVVVDGHYGSPNDEMHSSSDWEIAYADCHPQSLRITVIGDVNGDHFDDLLISCHYGADRSVYIYDGGPMGLGKTPSQIFDEYTTNLDSWKYATRIGDLNGDGFDDVISSNDYESALVAKEIYVFYGSLQGVRDAPDEVISIGDLGTFVSGIYFIRSPTARDFNADGIADIFYSANVSTMRLLCGSPDGFEGKPCWEASVYELSPPMMFGGWSMSSGYIDEDSMADVVISTAKYGIEKADLGYENYAFGFISASASSTTTSTTTTTTTIPMDDDATDDDATDDDSGIPLDDDARDAADGEDDDEEGCCGC